jgi:hypothetical protein
LRGYESGEIPEECEMPACPGWGAEVPELTARVARAASADQSGCWYAWDQCDATPRGRRLISAVDAGYVVDPVHPGPPDQPHNPDQPHKALGCATVMVLVMLAG